MPGRRATPGWTPKFSSTPPQLWSSISGAGLGGAWLPPTSDDFGSLGLAPGAFPLV